MKNWSDLFVMGVKELDQDHRQLLRIPEMIVERLDSENVTKKQWPFLVREGMRYMDGFYQSHLEREEAYMRQINYPHYEAHRQAHQEMGEIIKGYLSIQENPDDISRELDDVLKLLGSTYGWQMIHIAMDDMAIVGKGVMGQPPEKKLTDAALLQEINKAMKSLLNFNARTKIIDHDYQGDRLYSAVCEKITCKMGGKTVTLLLGAERTFVRFAAETFWSDKRVGQAHRSLMQWCLMAFAVGFWRNIVGRFTYDEPCVVQKIEPLPSKDVRRQIRKMDYKHSTLYETTKGRFFAVSTY